MAFETLNISRLSSAKQQMNMKSSKFLGSENRNLHSELVKFSFGIQHHTPVSC